jgi:hypothetical protein
MPDNAASARIVSQLRNARDWQRLLEGDVDAIRFAAFASPAECQELVSFIVRHPAAVQYSTAAGIARLGSSFSDVRKSDRLEEEYAKPDILTEALAVNSVVARLIGTIASSWPYGIETFRYKGFVLHRAIARRIIGGGAEPHDDNIAKEVADEPLALTVTIQLGVNLYVEMPEEGGELEGWHRRLNRDEYDALRNPDPQLSYGIRRDALPGCDWTIRPDRGDLVIFQNTELHAIQPSRGARTTWGFFLGYRGPAEPLLIWA